MRAWLVAEGAGDCDCDRACACAKAREGARESTRRARASIPGSGEGGAPKVAECWAGGNGGGAQWRATAERRNRERARRPNGAAAEGRGCKSARLPKIVTSAKIKQRRA